MDLKKLTGGVKMAKNVTVIVEKLFTVNKGAAKQLYKAVKNNDIETQTSIIRDIASQVIEKDGNAG